jgi:hypothetical protein
VGGITSVEKLFGVSTGKYVMDTAIIKNFKTKKHNVTKTDICSYLFSKGASVDTRLSIFIWLVESDGENKNTPLDELSDELLDELSNELLDELSNELLDELSNELLDELSNELLDELFNEMAEKELEKQERREQIFLEEKEGLKEKEEKLKRTRKTRRNNIRRFG